MQTYTKVPIARTPADAPSAARFILRCSLFAVASTAWMSAAAPARAQSSDSDAAAETQAAAATRAEKPANAVTKSKFDDFESLGEKGFEISRPGTADSILADTGGVRSALAKYGIGFLGIGSYSFYADFAKESNGTQYYLGQRPTFASSTSLSASLNLDQYGIPNAQITAAGAWLTTTWRPFGPPAITMQRLNYYQTFLDGRFELKAGIVANHFEFLGIQTAGNIISGTLGPGAGILYQTGLSRTPISAPGINVRWNAPGNFYVKSGVQRSTSPLGADAEHAASPAGLTFHTPRASALLINEVGYKRPAAVDERSVWLRGGALYNTSPYTVFGTTRSSTNHAFAVLADTQLIKTDPKFPARGIYGGVSFMKGDPNVDGTDQYYEARIYAIGIVPQRPDDFVSFVYTHNKFSGRVYALTQATGAPAIDRINNATLTYSIHLARGVFLVNGLTYGDHAATTPITRPALVFATALALIF